MTDRSGGSGSPPEGRGGDWLSELSNLRRDSLGVTDADRQRWLDEVGKTRVHEEAPAQEPPVRPPPRRVDRKVVAIVGGVVIVGLVSLAAGRRSAPVAPPPVTASPSSPSPATSPSAWVAPAGRVETVVRDERLPVAAPEASTAAWRLALAHLEISLVRTVGQPPLLSRRGDWSALEGPAVAMFPEAASDELDLCRRVLSSDKGQVTAAELFRRLAEFVATQRPPDEHALTLYLAGQYEAALSALEKATGSRTPPSRLAALRALCQVGRGTPAPQAAASIGPASSGTPDPFALSVAALLTAAAGRLGEASLLLPESSPQDPELAFRRGFIARLGGHEDGVAKVLESMALPSVEVATRAGARLVLAALALGAGQKARARELLGPLDTEKLPSSLKAAILALLVQAREGQPLLDDSRIGRALKLDPDSVWIRLSQARAAHAARSTFIALEYYQTYLDKVPDPVVRRELIEICLKESLPAAALGELSALLMSGSFTEADRSLVRRAIEALGKRPMVTWVE